MKTWISSLVFHDTPTGYQKRYFSFVFPQTNTHVTSHLLRPVLEEDWKIREADSVLLEECYTSSLTEPCSRNQNNLHHFDLNQGEVGEGKELFCDTN